MVRAMSADGGGLSWGVLRRLEFIEFRLFWEGGINRSDIMGVFGVSVPQASKDLALYQDRAPDNAVYDKRAKRYVAGPGFASVFLDPDPGGYLTRLRSLAEGLAEPSESWIAAPPEADVAAVPRQRVDPSVLRGVLAAIRGKASLEVRHRSTGAEGIGAEWRRISPHALGSDGSDWHVRGFCHVDEEFGDFPLDRILGVRSPGPAGASGAEDRRWNQTFDLWIGPRPGLTAEQEAVVATDFGMVDGRTVLTVRLAMLVHVLKRLGLLGGGGIVDPETRHAVVLNRSEAQAALGIDLPV